MKTAAFIAIAGLASVTSAEVLLIVDLTVADTITITATNGVSAANSAGSDNTGVLLADFFSTVGADLGELDFAGDLRAAGDSSSGNPGIWNDTDSVGLNFWGWTNDDSSGFTAGAVAFIGSSTWTLDSDDYAAALAGNTTGDIYAFADTDGDIALGGVPVIGQWHVIPTPSSLALLGLGGIVAGRRRR